MILVFAAKRMAACSWSRFLTVRFERVPLPTAGWTMLDGRPVAAPRPAVWPLTLHGGLFTLKKVKFDFPYSPRLPRIDHVGMLAKRVIPCLDVDRGRVVKGTNFVNLRDAGDPVSVAARYEGVDCECLDRAR